MKQWPQFNAQGNLPPGLHQATLDDALEHFGRGSEERIVVGNRLERVYRLAKSTGHLHRFAVFGSFVTDKPAPNDVDIFMIMNDDFDLNTVEGEAKVIFDHIAAQNYEGASVFWIRKMAAFEGEDAAIAHWQVTREGPQRGIIEVTDDDPK